MHAPQLVSGIEGERQPQVRSYRELESVGHDPDDRPAFAFQCDRPANDLRIASETAPPQAVALDHDRRAARRIFCLCEGSTQRRHHAERSKQLSGNVRLRQSLRLAASCESAVPEP